jgi:hypothetical protein
VYDEPRPSGVAGADRRSFAKGDVDAVVVRQGCLDDLLLHLAVERDEELLAKVVLSQVDQVVLLAARRATEYLFVDYMPYAASPSISAEASSGTSIRPKLEATHGRGGVMSSSTSRQSCASSARLPSSRPSRGPGK